jgi:hypothetical protein
MAPDSSGGELQQGSDPCCNRYGSGVAFRGFPVEGIEFYEQLAADNSRSFWQANKHRYDEFVKQPMVELTEELADFGPFHMFRPYNDVRFSKNKPPYKTAQGAYGESEAGAGHYVQFSADGLMVGAGYYAMAKDQLERFRTAIDGDATGAELAERWSPMPRSASTRSTRSTRSRPRPAATRRTIPGSSCCAARA